MKKHAIVLGLIIAISALAGLNSCGNMDDVDDQSPVLIVHIDIAAGSESTIIIDDTNKAYLMFYVDSTWLSPWLQFGANSRTLINPVVGTFSTYVAAFWDAQADGSTPATNGNGMLDPGEPCTGYVNANHSVLPFPEEMTEIVFFPLEWREITITLDVGITY